MAGYSRDLGDLDLEQLQEAWPRLAVPERPDGVGKGGGHPQSHIRPFAGTAQGRYGLATHLP